MQSINPATGDLLHEYAPHSEGQIVARIAQAHGCFLAWKKTPFSKRQELLHNAGAILRERKRDLALLMADEMGKPLQDGEAEILKCADACDYYCEHAEAFLKDENVRTEAAQSFISYQPIGIVLAIMPWNFPFWQVFRFAAPNLMAGNTGILKHASNVSGCALAIEQIFSNAGFPEGCFTTLLASGKDMESVIANPLVRAVTLTGSVEAGRKVAAIAGRHLKKTVMELGGSDAYVILADADIGAAATQCAKSRLINAGQSCIAAKRFIVAAAVRKAFEEAFIACFKAVRTAGPRVADEHSIGPMARADLRDALHEQVRQSVAQGATLLLGGVIPEGRGAFYPPTVLGDVKPGMIAFDEELFGPVAAIIEARDETEAFAFANQSRFGLGSAIFTSDTTRARSLASTAIDAGQTFVNAFVRSDPRLPFGGVKESGYGRELGPPGIREFVNIKTVYIA